MTRHARLDCETLRVFRRSRRGSTLVTFAAVAPVILGAMAFAAETVTWYTTQARLQRAADAAALNAAKELTLANRSAESIKAVAERNAAAHLGRNMDAATVVAAELVEGGAAVRVAVSRENQPIFGRIFQSGATLIRASATARVSGSTNVCVIGLSNSGGNIIRFRQQSRLTAQACAIYSNSSDSKGVAINDGAQVNASLICSAGGASVDATAVVSPSITRDCPKIIDPLAGRAEPAAGACTATGYTVSSGNVTLSPGTYCGGIFIGGTATVTLLPGIYIIKGGKLQVTKTSTLRGANVGFFFMPDGATSSNLQFDKLANIDLTAPKDGPLAGLLMFESGLNAAGEFRITSDNARVLLGTIYLPRSKLTVDSTMPVADLSAYTVIVSASLNLESGPNLHLNTNYSATDIPVPKGVGPIGRVVRLGN